MPPIFLPIMAEHQSRTDDIESGLQQENGPGLNDRQDADEYTALDRYISSLRDSRRLSVASQANDGDILENKQIPWWAPWRRLRILKHEDRGESNDGDETVQVPEAWLQTDMHDGLSESDIDTRRKKVGWNELTSEKENMFLKFLSYFQGPILYGLC